MSLEEGVTRAVLEGEQTEQLPDIAPAQRAPKHPWACQFVTAGLLIGTTRFDEFERRIALLPTERERGLAFEVFAEAYLATQRVSQAREVWPGNTMSPAVQQQLRLPSTDKGVDGAYVTVADEYACYQAKFRVDRPSLTWRELSTFFGLADASCQRVVITNCEEIAQVAEDRVGSVIIRGTDLDRLTPDDLRVIERWISGARTNIAPKKPKPHQIAAVTDAVVGLKRSRRATVLMACGTGKTLVALWVAEELQACTTLVLLPSLALVRQTLHQWLHETIWPDVEYLCVCSDPTVQEEDALIVRPSDLDFSLTPRAVDVRGFLTRDTSAKRIVFSTYHSSHLVAEATVGLPPFDFAVFDEAHKTAGREGAKFSLALDDRRLAVARRLFLTATPRHYKIEAKDKFGDAKIVFSMDVPEVYGPVVHRLPFSTAAKFGIITQYKVVISVITSAMVNDELLRRGVVLVEGEATKARQVANQIALRSAIEQYGVAKIFTFHANVKSAKSFTSAEAEGIATHLPGFHCAHINGEMSTAYRERLLREFERMPGAILSNARCLTEGVDVPAVDMIAFLSPRRSLVDIVQATGRAMRKAPGKQFGYVLVPLYVEQNRGETVEEAVLRSNFDEVWNILNRLQEHDDLLAQTIAAMQIQRGETGGFDDSRFRERVEILGPTISLENLRKSITAACLDVIGKSWFRRYGELVAYHAKHGHCDVPAKSKQDKRLATWVVAQRYERRNDRLSTEQIDLLDRLGFTWDPYSVEWRGNYVALMDYKRIHGHCDVPQYGSTDRKLAQWVKTQRLQRKRGKLSSERIALLDRVGFNWEIANESWEERFEQLCGYKQRFHHTRVPVKWKENPQLGRWVVAQRYRQRKSKLRPEHEQRLSTIGFEWDVPRAIPTPELWEKKFASLAAFREKTGGFDFAQADPSERALATWVQDQRSLKRKGRLAPDRERRLSEIGLTWESTAPGSEAYWRARFEELRRYASVHGTTKVADDDAKSRSLKEWAGLQRALRRKGKLSDDRVRSLDSLGFIWNPPRGKLGISAGDSTSVDGLQPWTEMHDALVAFFKLHGHCRVPDPWPANPALARWVSWVRAAKRSGQLSEEQLSSLDRLGFSWTAFEAEWDIMFPKLAATLQAQAERPKAGTELSRWIATIRRYHRRGALSTQCIEKLNRIGFSFSPDGDRWKRMFSELEKFQSQYEHCRVPFKWHENPRLAVWVGTQRYFRRTGKLSAERIAALESLGFSWSVAPAPAAARPARNGRQPFAAAWEEMFDRFSAFVSKHGHAQVPQNFPEDRKLGWWVTTQRQQRRKGKLTDARIGRLDQLGFVWGSPHGNGNADTNEIHAFENRWNEMFAGLKQYRATHNHCRVPTGWPENPRLANWVAVQRRRRKIEKLSAARMAALDALGFDWQIEKEHVPASETRPPAIATDRDRWDEMFAALGEYRKLNGHCRVPQRPRSLRPLADWVCHQRVAYREGVLDPERQRLLADLDFDWDPIGSRWNEMFGQLVAYNKTHGTTHVPASSREYAQLARWVKNQRRDKKLGRPISAERVKRLDEIGFIWSFIEQTDWDDMFKLLEEFKARHGHCNVPQKFPENRRFGRWVNTQRLRFKQRRLSRERQQRLQSLGFVWNMKTSPSHPHPGAI